MLKKISIYPVVLLLVFTAAAEPLATNLTPESAVVTALADNRDLAAARFGLAAALNAALRPVSAAKMAVKVFNAVFCFC